MLSDWKYFIQLLPASNVQCKGVRGGAWSGPVQSGGPSEFIKHI